MGEIISAPFQIKASKANQQAQEAQAKAQAQADAFNADIMERNARIVEGQTKAALEREDRQRRLRLGSQIAQGSTGGLSGSALDIIRDSAEQETLNILTIKQQGMLEKQSLLEQAALTRASGSNTLAQIPLLRKAGVNERLGIGARAIGKAAEMGATGGKR